MPKVHTGKLTVSELHAGDGVIADFVYCFSISLFQPFLDTFGSTWIARAYLVSIYFYDWEETESALQNFGIQ